MAPSGYRTGTYSDCDSTADVTWVGWGQDCDSTATAPPHFELVELHEVEPPEDLRELFHGPFKKMVYKPPKRMVGLQSRFYKPPNHMSGGQINKEKRKARLQL